MKWVNMKEMSGNKKVKLDCKREMWVSRKVMLENMTVTLGSKKVMLVSMKGKSVNSQGLLGCNLVKLVNKSDLMDPHQVTLEHKQVTMENMMVIKDHVVMEYKVTMEILVNLVVVTKQENNRLVKNHLHLMQLMD